MEISDRLISLRKEAGYTQAFVAKQLGIASQNYSKWEKGHRVPKKDTLEKLAKVFNVSVSYLLGETDIKESSEILTLIEQLSQEKKEELIEVAEQVAENDTLSLQVTKNDVELHKYYVLPQALSAGHGNSYTDEVEPDIVYWKYYLNYDQAVWIKGESMEPTFPDHNVALIKEQPFLEYEGQICAVDDVENGRAYIKCVYLDNGGFKLRSINQEVDDRGKLKYPDIFLPFEEDPRIIGKVIGHFTPEEI